MKVAHLVSTFPPYRGGIGNAAYHISWELAQLGHSVTVFTPRRLFGDYSLDQSLPFKVKRLIPFARYGNAAFVPQLLWAAGNFDIVHLHYPFFGGAEMLYLRDIARPLTIVLHYHMDVVGEGIMKRFFEIHSKQVLPRILDHAASIIVTSMDYAQQSRIRDMLSVHSAKCVTVPLGVNPDVFKPRMKNRELLDRHGLHHKKVILFVGSLDRAHYFKGVNYLIKAFQLIASNDNYRLIVVGGGSLKKSYESITINFGLDRKIIFTGEVPNDALPLYYNLADVFVLPSIDSSEAFGMAILEAMSSGIAVVASDLPGVRSVVQKDVTGQLVKPRAINALAKYLHFLLENPQVTNRLGVEGRARVMREYTWESVGKAVQDVYQRLKP